MYFLLFLNNDMMQVVNSLRPTHISIDKLTIIGSDNGLSPERRQAIISTNAGILSIGPLGTNFSEILIEIQSSSLKKIRLNMSSAKCCSFRLGLNVLTFFLMEDKDQFILHCQCHGWSGETRSQGISSHGSDLVLPEYSGPWFNIKMSSYQYRKSHCGDKTVVRSSYLHNGISYTGKMSYLYWIGALVSASEGFISLLETCLILKKKINQIIWLCQKWMWFEIRNQCFDDSEEKM